MTNLFISDTYNPDKYPYSFTIDGLHGLSAYTFTSLEYIQDINKNRIELVFSVASRCSSLLGEVLNTFRNRRHNYVSFIKDCKKYLVRCSYNVDNISIGQVEHKDGMSYLVIDLLGVKNVTGVGSI